MVRRYAGASRVQIASESPVAALSRLRGRSRGAPLNPRDVTAVVLARDEAHQIERALRSLPGGVRAFVLDAKSRDETVQRAKACGAQVLTRPWTDFVDARRFALAQIETPWAFVLDADEELDELLRSSLLACDGTAAGYNVLRTTYYCGKPMRLWSNEALLRLVRRDMVSIETRPTAGSAALHEHFVVSGETGSLQGTLLHYSYPTRSSYWRKFRRYTAIEASGLKPSPWYALRALAAFPLRFARLLLRGGLRDGWRGMTIAYGSALYPVAVALRALGRRGPHSQ